MRCERFCGLGRAVFRWLEFLVYIALEDVAELLGVFVAGDVDSSVLS